MTLEERLEARRKALTDLDRPIRELRHELHCAQAETCDLRDRLDDLETRIAQNR